MPMFAELHTGGELGGEISPNPRQFGSATTKGVQCVVSATEWKRRLTESPLARLTHPEAGLTRPAE